MNEFWTNISRYPRFFISSVLGLIFIILTPLRTLFKIKKFRVGFLLISLLALTILIMIIRIMTAI